MEWGDQEFKIQHRKYPSRNVKEDFGDMKRKSSRCNEKSSGYTAYKKYKIWNKSIIKQSRLEQEWIKEQEY